MILEGLEPTASGIANQCPSFGPQDRIHSRLHFDDLGRTRTSNLWFRKPALYPLNYETKTARTARCTTLEGLEPPTP